jgi:hypothetical protein
MAKDAGSLKKAAVLTGLTVLMGGAETSRVEAATFSETQPISASSGGITPAPLSFNQFNPSQGSLTSVEFVLTSTLTGTGPVVGFNGASVSINGNTLGSFSAITIPFGSPPLSASFNFDRTDGLSLASNYIGTGTFPVGLTIGFADCGGESCHVDWTGSLQVTFNPTTPLPASLPLLATGLAGLGLVSWRSRRKQKAKVES